MEEISADLAQTYGVDVNQMKGYVKGVTLGLATLDNDHATEFLKEVFRKEIERMQTEMQEKDIDLEEDDIEKEVERMQKMIDEINDELNDDTIR